VTDKTLDCSDLENYLGKPMQPGRLREPLSNTNIRRWAQAMHYPNRLHYDNDFAADSRFNCIVAPQSFPVATDDGHGAAPSCIGLIPQSHMLFGGDEWWFHGPRVAAGDLMHNERVPLDYVIKETRFAGPTCFQRGDNNYYTDKGDKVATQRSTSIRYRADLAREMNSSAATEDPPWTDEQLAELDDRKFEWIKMLHDLGHGKRYWDDVQVGDKLTPVAKGPFSMVDVIAYHMGQGLSHYGIGPLRYNWMQRKRMPGFYVEDRFGVPDVAQRVHWDHERARDLGLPTSHDYGQMRANWLAHLVTNWIGDDGWLWKLVLQTRAFNFMGDTTICSGEVTGKRLDGKHHVVDLALQSVNQRGENTAPGTAVVILPTRAADIDLPEPSDAFASRGAHLRTLASEIAGTH
jgi:acyl dehydratase